MHKNIFIFGKKKLAIRIVKIYISLNMYLYSLNDQYNHFIVLDYDNIHKHIYNGHDIYNRLTVFDLY